MGARVTKSCGCLRKLDAFLATTYINDLTEEYLYQFDDFDKFLLIHHSIRQNIPITELDINTYKTIIEYFYNQEQFNLIYNFWKSQEKTNTFYDWAKPSLDHITPKSKGGSNNYTNWQFLTVFENLSKRDMTMDEWNNFKKITNTHSDYYLENIKGVDKID